MFSLSFFFFFRQMGKKFGSNLIFSQKIMFPSFSTETILHGFVMFVFDCVCLCLWCACGGRCQYSMVFLCTFWSHSGYVWLFHLLVCGLKLPNLSITKWSKCEVWVAMTVPCRCSKNGTKSTYIICLYPAYTQRILTCLLNQSSQSNNPSC